MFSKLNDWLKRVRIGRCVHIMLGFEFIHFAVLCTSVEKKDDTRFS